MKIMVVDDEPLISQYIVQCIRGADANAEIVGAVNSGMKALHQMEETPADLVFADITMPKMDGLQLLKEIKRKYPAVDVIMLTCHDDFEYARTAIQNQASDYILKSEVSADRLRVVLDTVKQARQQRIATGTVQQISRNHYLRHLVEQDDHICPIRECDLRDNHIYLRNDAFIVMLFENNEHNMTWMQADVAEYFENPLFYAYSNQEMFMLANLRKESGGRQADTAQEAMPLIAMQGIVGCSRIHHRIERLQTACCEAMLDSNIRFYQAPQEGFKVEAGVERVETSIMRATVRLEEQAIKEGCKEVERLLEQAKQHHVHVYFLKEALQQLFVGIRRKMGIDLCETERIIGDSCTFTALCTAVQEGLDQVRGKGRLYSDAIRKAMDYMDTHYAEDISLNTVADVVYLNRDYLSRQFKREVGINFSEYLMSLRMKRAKQLLETTGMRISDIALQVGITNMSYFSTVFHKSFGHTPNEVRKMRKDQ